MNKLALVHLFHILIVGSLFLYIGIKKTEIPLWMYPTLVILGIIIILYHSYLIYVRTKKGIPAWINYIHVFLIGPLLVYIGIYKTHTKRRFFEILLMLGFASIGYHGYYLFSKT